MVLIVGPIDEVRYVGHSLGRKYWEVYRLLMFDVVLHPMYSRDAATQSIGSVIIIVSLMGKLTDPILLLPIVVALT